MRSKKIVVLVLLVAVLSNLFAVPTAWAAAPTPTQKKAIYILPGYTESRLFSKRYNGERLWVGWAYAKDLTRYTLGVPSELTNNASGTGMTAYADRNEDPAGVADIFQCMIDSINSCLRKNNLQNTYNVEFFSYNFIADVNESAAALEADIKAKGYESVILITHSNGSILASSFLTRNPNNKSLVEKAIVLGATFYGSYKPLEPIETGLMTLFDGSVEMALLELAYDILFKPITKNWVRSWAKNSPGLYQMFPSEEYIKRVPIMYKTTAGTKAINNIEEYYSLLNKSPNINPNLINGNQRSLKYLRNTVLKGDVLGIWEDMDVTLVGSEYGLITPYTVVYRQVGTKAVYDGMIYSKAGDGMLMGFSANGDGRLPYINVTRTSHIPMVMDSNIHRIINDLLEGKKPSGNGAPGSSSVGMTDTIRVEIKSNDPLKSTPLNKGIAVNIYDSRGKVVAKSAGSAQTGFEENNFVYSSWDTSLNQTNIVCYIPKKGYTMEVFTGLANRMASSMVVYTETMDQSGAILSRDEYKLTGANLVTGSVFKLDASKSTAPVASSGARLTKLTTESYKQNWQFGQSIISLIAGRTSTPTITGPDAVYMKSANYIWTSNNPRVATVSSTGVITAVSRGTCVITAIAKDNSFKIGLIRVTVN